MEGPGQDDIMYANVSIAQTKAFQTFRGQKGGLPLPPAEITYESAAEWRATEGREKLIMFWIAHASGVISVLNGVCPAIWRNVTVLSSEPDGRHRSY